MILPVPLDKARDAFIDGGRRSEAMVALDRADVRERILDVARLHRLRVDQRLPARRLLQKLDDAHQVLAAAVADIVERVGAGASAGLHRAVVERRRIEAGEDSAHDIVDEGEVAPHLAAVVKR